MNNLVYSFEALKPLQNKLIRCQYEVLADSTRVWVECSVAGIEWLKGYSAVVTVHDEDSRATVAKDLGLVDDATRSLERALSRHFYKG